jgi:hypothetical protein
MHAYLHAAYIVVLGGNFGTLGVPRYQTVTVPVTGTANITVTCCATILTSSEYWDFLRYSTVGKMLLYIKGMVFFPSARNLTISLLTEKALA